MSGSGACRDNYDSVLDDQPPAEPPAAERSYERIVYACPNCGQVDSHAENCLSSPQVLTATCSDCKGVSNVEGKIIDVVKLCARHRQHDKLVAALRQVVDWYEGRVHNGPQERTRMYEAAKQALADVGEGEA